jgi:riboflavin biosynthesis pyrimidine reductase
VDVAQLVELLVVVQAVVGSNPIVHPSRPAEDLIDEYEVYLNPLVWGRATPRARRPGTVRLELDDVKRFDSGVVLLTYRPAA